MYKTTVNYEDFLGNKRTEVLRFNITEAELTEMNLNESQLKEDGEIEGGIKEKLETIMKTGNGKEILKAFKDIIFLSYGELDDDGRRFRKGAEISRAFEESMAYNEFFTSIISDEKKATTFINEAMPKSIREQAEKVQPQDKPDLTRRPKPTVEPTPAPVVPETEPTPVAPEAPSDDAIAEYLARQKDNK